MISANIDEFMQRSFNAFQTYKKSSLKNRSAFMQAIADAMESRKKALIGMAAKETNLSEKRLNAELARTAFQMRSYGQSCARAEWMDIRIDTADAAAVPPKADLRKMVIPLGPVIVFGAANFPFAYSTAGGDTACAFAAGCTVVVKVHPGHLQTGILVAEAIDEAIRKCNLPKDIFIHVTDTSVAAGEALVKHPHTKAVGFTGSFKGGKQLFDWGNQREVPILVFAEMSSVNPVFIFPEKLKADFQQTAEMLAASVTLDVGQFCTNPGIMIAVDDPSLYAFTEALKKEFTKILPAVMLNAGIEKNYSTAKKNALSQQNVNIVYDASASADKEAVTLAITSAKSFIENNILQQEVFGPYAIIVKCKDMNEMNDVALNLQGQLTATIIAAENEVKENEVLVENIRAICGRVIMNGVPTGVAVCLAMQHGGPFPASTDSRFTSVGADGIKRFARPQSFQSWPDELLPDELKEKNPLGIWRTVNGKITNG